MRKKSSASANVKVKSFGLLPMHLDMLTKITEAKGYLSESEALRNAISFFYEKVFPDYIYNKSAADSEKRKKLREKEQFDKMTNEELVEKNFPEAPIVEGEGGKKYFLVHWWGNAVVAKEVDEIKSILEKTPDAVDNHIAMLKERGPVLEYVKERKSAGLLKADYGIVV